MARLSRAQQGVRDQILQLEGRSLLPEAAGNRLLALLQLVIPADSGVLFGIDPNSLLFNRILAINEGFLSGRLWWLQNIYLTGEPIPELTFPGLMRANLSAVSMHDLPQKSLGIPPDFLGSLAPTTWQRIYYETLTPDGGLLRGCFAANGRWIAALELFRLDTGKPFHPTDVGFVRLLAPLIGRILSSAFEYERALCTAEVGPDDSGILVLEPDGRVRVSTPAAETWSKLLRDSGMKQEKMLPTAIWSAVARLRSGQEKATDRVLHVWTPAGNLRVEASQGGEDGSTAVLLAPERPPASFELPLHWPLTPQERQVVLLVARGLSNRQIAARLVVNESTVESHLVHVYEKLQVHSRTELLACLFRELFLPDIPTPEQPD
jgi:DNA-binding CsgD family transcriptional regulator